MLPKAAKYFPVISCFFLVVPGEVIHNFPESFFVRIWICGLVLCVHVDGRGQSIQYPVTAPFNSLAAYGKNFPDVLSIPANQAALSRIESFAAGIYSEKRFLLKELNSIQMQLGFPFKKGSIGLGAVFLGTPGYSESILSLSYGMNLGQVAIGAQFNYALISIAGYGNKGILNFELGLLYQLTEKLMAGMHVRNPVGVKFGLNNDEKLAALINAGLGYEVSDKVLTALEIIKEEDRPITISAGLQYVLAGRFFLKLGLLTASASPWLSAGLSWNQWRVDISSNWHPQLGITPGIQLRFNSAGRKQ